MHGLSPIPPRPPQQLYIDPDVPAYMVVEKRGFVDDRDHLWLKGETIYWEGIPSMGLDPVNEMAEGRMREHLERLDAHASAVAKAKGSAHASLVNAFEARRRIQMLDKRENGRSADREASMPIMRAKKESSMARSVNAGPPQTPIMGHQGRYSVAPAQARALPAKNAQAKNVSAKGGVAQPGKKGFQPKVKPEADSGRAEVNKDDKGF